MLISTRFASKTGPCLTTAILALAAGQLPVHAQLTVNSFNTTATVDFDNTVSGVNNGTWSGLPNSGFQPSPNAGQLDSDAWAVTGWSDGNLAFGGTRTTGDYARGALNNSAAGTAGFYAVSGGNITTGVALGIQPGSAGDFNPGTLTLKIRNNTGSTVTSLALSYLLYVRNDQARSSSFNFSYSGDDTSYTSVSALDYTSGEAGDGLGFVANNFSTTLTGLNVANGSDFYIRWSSQDVGGSGLQRDEFALDNIGVTAVPEPGAWAVMVGLGLAAWGGVRLRRR